MLTRLLLTLALLCLTALPACAQPSPKIFIFNKTLLPAADINQYYFGPGANLTGVTQKVLSSAKPALLGPGPGLRTLVFSTGVTDAAVIADPGDLPARMRVEGLRLYGDHPNLAPGLWPGSPNDTEVADGIRLHGGVNDTLAKAHDVLVERFRGAGVDMTAWTQLRNSHLKNLYIGVDARGADIMVSDVWAEFCRDYCLKSSSSNQSYTGNHWFGAGVAAVHVTTAGRLNRWVNDVMNDSPLGLECLGEHNTFSACHISQNYEQTGKVTAQNNEFIGCTMRVNAASDNHDTVKGMEFTSGAKQCRIIGGSILLNTDVGVGNTIAGPAQYTISIASDDFVMRDTQLRDGDGYSGSTGIKIIGAVKGLRVDVPVFGYTAATDKILILDEDADAGMRGAIIVIRSSDTNLTASNVGDYFDTTGFHSSNSVTFINTITGEEIVLDAATAY